LVIKIPPTDENTLHRLAEAFQADYQRLENLARSYKPRPPFIIEHAKKRCHSTARRIGDIVQKKRLEAQLAQADRLSSMGMLAAGVAHEINNPLAYILCNLQSLGEDMPRLLDALRRFQWRLSDKLSGDILDELLGADAEEFNPAMLDDIQDRLKDALEGTYRIRNVSRSLGAFSRVEKDKLVLINLVHVIEVALNMAFNEIKYRARLVKDYSRNLPLVFGSEGRLGQVFLNLLINATHAIDEGDIQNNEIRVSTWVENGWVFAQVRDTGSGIASENIDKLFEPFFTTKKIGVGSGLGLAISKDIVEGYGGSIEVESEVGKGSCFTIRLPVQDEEAISTDDHPDESLTEIFRGRILIIDDEEGILVAMARMICEHETVLVSSGAEAKQVIDGDQAFDLVLCDMMMPDISGMDLHRWLTEHHPVLARQLIFVTGGAFTPRARDYLSTVDNVCLEKPFDENIFKRIVNDAIHAGRRHR
jgi:signal transduction histidine kinase